MWQVTSLSGASTIAFYGCVVIHEGVDKLYRNHQDPDLVNHAGIDHPSPSPERCRLSSQRIRFSRSHVSLQDIRCIGHEHEAPVMIDKQRRFPEPGPIPEPRSRYRQLPFSLRDFECEYARWSS